MAFVVEVVVDQCADRKPYFDEEGDAIEALGEVFPEAPQASTFNMEKGI